MFVLAWQIKNSEGVLQNKFFQNKLQGVINTAQKQCQSPAHDNNSQCMPDGFLPRGPYHLLQFRMRFLDKLCDPVKKIHKNQLIYKLFLLLLLSYTFLKYFKSPRGAYEVNVYDGDKKVNGDNRTEL